MSNHRIQLYDISFFSLGILNSKITAIEEENIYNSIPQFIFQNKGWIIKSMDDIKTHLPHLSENDTIQLANNYQTQMYIHISKHRSNDDTVLIPDAVRNNSIVQRLAVGSAKTETNISPAQVASLIPLPASDDDQDYPDAKNKPKNPSMLCFDNIINIMKLSIYYLTEFFSIFRPLNISNRH